MAYPAGHVYQSRGRACDKDGITVENDHYPNYPEALSIQMSKPEADPLSRYNFKELMKQGDFLGEVDSGGNKYRFFNSGILFAQVFNSDGDEQFITEGQFTTDTLSHRDRQNLVGLLSNFDRSSHQIQFSDTLRIRPVGLAGGNDDAMTMAADEAMRAGFGFLEQGNRQEALRMFQQSWSRLPEGWARYGRRFQLMDEMAPLLFELKQFDELKRLTNYISKFTGGTARSKSALAPYYYYCGRATLEQKIYQEAIRYFNQSVDYMKSRPYPDLTQCRDCYFYLAQSHEIMATYSKALESYRLARALGFGANADEGISRIVTAEPDLRGQSTQPIALPSHLEIMTRALVVLLLKRGWDVYQANPTQAKYFFEIAEYYSQNLPEERSQVCYAMACALNMSKNPGEAMSKVQEAIQVGEPAVKRRPKGTSVKLHEYYNFLAYLQEVQKCEPSVSQKSMDDALNRAFFSNLSTPTWYAQAYHNKARHLERAQDFKGAARLFLVAGRIDPSYAAANDNLNRIVAAHPDCESVKSETIRLREYVPYAENSTLHQDAQKELGGGSCVIC